MGIKDWPDNDRPREKLLQLGPAALSDSELLAIFLRTGTRGKSAVDLARHALKHFGSLRALFQASLEALSQVSGFGIAKYTQLQAVLEMSRRHLHETLQRGDIISNVNDTRRYLTTCLRGYQHEVFACLFLDSRHRIISFDELFSGTIDGASVHPREVVKHTLHHNAAAVIFAHNHPSGVAEPSLADLEITRQLKQALELIEVRVLDHMIVGDNEVISMAERGLI
jgi:DNA repair protein RadC